MESGNNTGRLVTMYLLICATELEAGPLRALLQGKAGVELLISGAGPIETTLTLCKFLARTDKTISAIVNCGIAGAYPDTGVGLLDICLARREKMGDFGICTGNTISAFDDPAMTSQTDFNLDNSLLACARQILNQEGISYHTGVFVTVNCASGAGQRGEFLRHTHQAICENMEGAALARVCMEFNLPLLEVRCVSNIVIDRDRSKWKLAEAVQKNAEITGLLLTALLSRQSF